MSNATETGKQFSSISYYARYGDKVTFDRDGSPEQITGDGQYEHFVTDGLASELGTPLTGLQDPRLQKMLDRKVLKEMKAGSTIKIGNDEWKVDRAGFDYEGHIKTIQQALKMGSLASPAVFIMSLEIIEAALGMGEKELQLSSTAQVPFIGENSPASDISVSYSGDRYSEVRLNSRFKDGAFDERHVVSAHFNANNGKIQQETIIEQGERFGYR